MDKSSNRKVLFKEKASQVTIITIFKAELYIWTKVTTEKCFLTKKEP